ncbi:hypothetical protein EIP91_012090 [Steccherinum ochraceum]|uniref:C2H2-type domain-containing protein n=1 Tax=Steccherinum ochraceum TaxID=92696 RepID=A0A4R0RV94_9APHY|nr:hypothetical protein EIP91_012090 [Steccherinum ochraceum]
MSGAQSELLYTQIASVSTEKQPEDSVQTTNMRALRPTNGAARRFSKTTGGPIRTDCATCDASFADAQRLADHTRLLHQKTCQVTFSSGFKAVSWRRADGLFECRGRCGVKSRDPVVMKDHMENCRDLISAHSFVSAQGMLRSLAPSPEPSDFLAFNASSPAPVFKTDIESLGRAVSLPFGANNSPVSGSMADGGPSAPLDDNGTYEDDDDASDTEDERAVEEMMLDTPDREDSPAVEEPLPVLETRATFDGEDVYSDWSSEVGFTFAEDGNSPVSGTRSSSVVSYADWDEVVSPAAFRDDASDVVLATSELATVLETRATFDGEDVLSDWTSEVDSTFAEDGHAPVSGTRSSSVVSYADPDEVLSPAAFRDDASDVVLATSELANTSNSNSGAANADLVVSGTRTVMPCTFSTPDLSPSPDAEPVLRDIHPIHAPRASEYPDLSAFLESIPLDPPTDLRCLTRVLVHLGFTDDAALDVLCRADDWDFFRLRKHLRGSPCYLSSSQVFRFRRALKPRRAARPAPTPSQNITAHSEVFDRLQLSASQLDVLSQNDALLSGLEVVLLSPDHGFSWADWLAIKHDICASAPKVHRPLAAVLPALVHRRAATPAMLPASTGSDIAPGRFLLTPPAST